MYFFLFSVNWKYFLKIQDRLIIVSLLLTDPVPSLLPFHLNLHPFCISLGNTNIFRIIIKSKTRNNKQTRTCQTNKLIKAGETGLYSFTHFKKESYKNSKVEAIIDMHGPWKLKKKKALTKKKCYETRRTSKETTEIILCWPSSTAGPGAFP